MAFNESSKFYIQAKKLLDEYVLNGGNVNDLTKHHPIYKYIMGGKAVDENGVRLTVDEKFIRLGHPRTVSFEDKAKKLLEEYVSSGHSVDELKSEDKLYNYIKNTRILDAEGKFLDVETKFAYLGYPRKRMKSKDVREALINAIDQYLISGGSFHIERKKLPFYALLEAYSNTFKRRGEYLTHEQIMRDDLGYRQFSDLYYRCKGLEQLKEYKDEDGYVDDVHSNKQLTNYIMQLAETLKVPYYFVVTLLADQKFRKYSIQLDKVKYTEGLLMRSYARRRKLTGLKDNDPYVYNAFDYLARYYSDGSEMMFSKKEWLEIFGLGDIKNSFDDRVEENVDIEDIIAQLKHDHPDGFVVLKKIDIAHYRAIIKKSVQMGVSVNQLLQTYGLRSKGSSVSRLSRARVDEIPYFDEMKKRRDELMLQSGISVKNGYFKEEVFEQKVKVIQQVYAEFKERLETYVPTVQIDDVEDLATSDN